VLTQKLKWQNISFICRYLLEISKHRQLRRGNQERASKMYASVSSCNAVIVKE